MSHEPADDQRDEAVLRGKAREVVQAGTLPNRRPDRTWGGSGIGADCTICRTPVKPDEFEFEIEFESSRNGDSPGRDTYHVHVRCFVAWELERDNAGLPRTIPSGRQAHEPRDAS